MSKKSFKVSKSLYLNPINLATILDPQDGELAIDINDSNKLKKYSTTSSTWVEVGSGGSSVDNTTDELLIQNFESAVLADFTQTGLELISSPFIHGTKTARLIHQASSTRSFKQTKSIDPKFRGKNLTLRLDARSCALSANVTVLVTDETNSTTLISSTFTTGQITAAVFNTTNASASVTVTDNSILNSISIGASITGSGIPTGTTITAVNSTAGTITISNAATATATGVSLKVSALPNVQSYAFDIPTNCSSISYTVTALQEAGSPETYVDDIVIELTDMAMTSTSVTVPKAVENSFSEIWNLSGASGSIISFQTNPIISTITNSANVYTASFVAGSFSVSPNISLTIQETDDTGATEVRVISTSPTGFTFRFYDYNGSMYPASGASGLRIHVKLEKQGADFVDPLTATETKTIPLTSSVLVTQPDFNLTLSQSTTVAANTVVPFDTILKSSGSGITNTSGNFTVTEAGVFTISTTLTNSTAANISAQILVDNVVRQYETSYPSAGAGITLTHTEYLNVGQVVTIKNLNNTAASGATVSITKNNSTKILNPSSDQKVEIPTHELRFEGASARGSVATAIVKFDTLAKIKGDGFEVINTAADGTYVRIKKSGRLSVSASVAPDTSGQAVYLSKNQQVLTSNPVQSEIINAGVTSTNGSYTVGVSGTIDVVVGDLIRVACSSAVSVGSQRDTFVLSLQETSVAVALQNVAPRWDDSDTSLMLSGANGFGTTATTVRRFSSVTNNLGTAISYSDTPAGGAVFTVNESGLYSIKYQDDQSFTSPTSYGISIGNSVTPTSIAYQTFSQLAVVGISSGVIYLTKGQTFVVGSVNPGNVATSSIYTRLYISKVGKTQGTVDVTPFVQIPQFVQDNFVSQTANGFGSTATAYYRWSNPIKNTNNGVLQWVSDPVNGDYFKALTSCSVSGSFNANFGTTNPYTHVTVWNSNLTLQIYTASTIQGYSSNGTQEWSNPFNVKLSAGEVIRFSFSGATPTFAKLSVVATASSSSIISQTDQVSSDTISLAFKPTAIVDSDPVGTFNTYLYTANTNTAVIQATAPTQTIADMNVNGIRVYARPFNSAGTVGLPARVDIKIGKGLKNFKLLGYANTGKTGDFSFDRVVVSSTDERGLSYSYSEATGILSLNAGSCYMSSTTTRYIDAFAGLTNGYFAFNASKTASLITVPNLQPRIAYLSDVKPSGTGGGTATAGAYAARTLNTIVDNTGIVTSQASNRFTLPAGTYDIEAIAPAGYCNSHKIKLRNITDSTDAIIGGVNYINAATGFYGSTNATLAGSIVITSPKTFELQHRVETTRATDGLGQGLGYGDNNIFAQVKITKIK